MLSTFVIVGLIVLVLLISFYILVVKKVPQNNYWKKRNVFVLDMDAIVSFTNRFLFSKHFYQIEYEAYKITKNSGQKYSGILQSLTPNLLVVDLELMKQILIKDFDFFINRRPDTADKADPVGHLMLGNTRGLEWKILRGIMIPAFTTSAVRRNYNIIQESCNRMITFMKLKAGGDGRQDVDFRDLFIRYTTDNMGGIGFGIETFVFDEEKETLFAKMARRMQNRIDEKSFFKLFLEVFAQKICNILRIAINDREAVDYLVDITRNIIDTRRKTDESGQDFIQMMMDANIKNLSDDSIIANTILFFLANPVATVLEFGVYELALNQNVQESLYNEINLTEKTGNGIIEYNDLHSMSYLDQVICETLRRYPPSIRTERSCNKSYKIPDSDLVLEKGTIVTFSIFGIQHDVEYFPDPFKFDPERFNTENKSQRNPYSYLAFGYGQRGCIAMKFALTLCKLALVEIIKNFKLEPSKHTHIPMKYARTGYKASESMYLNITPRKINAY